MYIEKNEDINKIKLYKYLVYDDIYNIRLCCNIINLNDFFHLDVYYEYDKKNNTLQKLNDTIGVMMKKDFLKKSIILTTDNEDECIDYLQIICDSKKYNI